MIRKRLVKAGGLVGAVALGAMVIAGPTAEAATAIPATGGYCSALTFEAAQWLYNTGLSVPDPITAQNVINNVVFYAAVLTGPTQAAAEEWDYVLNEVCG